MPEQAKGKCFLRYCVLKVGSSSSSSNRKSDNGIDLSNLKIEFECIKNSTADPNSAVIKVYNLNEDTVNKILYEYDTVELEAGYANGNKGLIFHGNISEITHTREKYVDTITEIKCEDGGNGYKFAVTSKSVSSGATDEDLLNIVLSDYSNYGITQGSIDKSLLSNTQYPRGQVLHTNTREVANVLANNHGMEVSIQDGQLQLIQAKKTLDINAEIISSETGLVDPGVQFNEDGISFKMLLNTNLKVGCPVKVDEAAYTTRYVNKLDHSKDKLPQTGSLFKVIQVKHTGNTRDNTWYSDCTAVTYTNQADDQKDLR